MSDSTLAVDATSPYQRAIAAVNDLLKGLKVDSLFVGGIARVAWLGGQVREGAIDALALLSQEQKNQAAMMASNRGFHVDRDEILATEELDLIPMKFRDGELDIRVHLLLASNALYGRIVAAGRSAACGQTLFKVPRAEDFALLLTVSGDDDSMRMRQELLLRTSDRFDRREFNERLVSIGLPRGVVGE